MKRLVTLSIVLLGFSTFSFGQEIPDPMKPQGENLKVPEGWEIRLDKPMENLVVSSSPDSGDIYFVNMTPGWHITTGPRAIYWHPAHDMKGDYGIKTNLYLFNTKGRDREGYGIFFGGSNLKEDNQRYIYFLLRNTGEFLIKERMGADTKVIQNWTASDAIVLYKEDMGDEGSAENNLQVKVDENSMTFIINGQEVSKMEKGDLSTDGIFGLRVNHNVNLHISEFGMLN